MEHQDGTFKSMLKEVPGVEQPSAVSSSAVQRLKAARKPQLSVDEFVEGITQGNRTILSQAITLVESSLHANQEIAQQIIEKCLPFSGKSVRIGITGVPGVGKSSFIETFGVHITSLGHQLAVLAIDPSSEKSRGSILGDKTRMEKLATDPKAYIRPSPSAGTLGGVARKTRETIILCEAAGFNVIFIETVGVGQSETAVHSMVDFFLLLMLAGAGDELQGIKRGIMEMADSIAITKADGENIDKAKMAKVQYASALHLFPKSESCWAPVVQTCSAHNGVGIEAVWNTISDYLTLVQNNGYFDARRNFQSKYWMHETILEKLKTHFYDNKHIKESIDTIEEKVLRGETSSFTAAGHLLETYFTHIHNKHHL
jgi:LAO/AO transport system kinase